MLRSGARDSKSARALYWRRMHREQETLDRVRRPAFEAEADRRADSGGGVGGAGEGLNSCLR
eukprot:9480003-Alexandrium_andersonii.AAC.1